MRIKPCRLDGYKEHSHERSFSGLILSPSLSEQDEGLLVGIYIHMYNVDPSSSWAQRLSLLSSYLWILFSQLLPPEYMSL